MKILPANRLILISTIALCLVISGGLSVAHAQTPTPAVRTYTALEPLPCIPGNGVVCTSPGALQSNFNFENYVQYMFNLFIAISAAAAVFMIVFGGLQYMTTDSWSGKSAGLDRAKKAVYGLLLVLSSYIILRTVDPRLVAIPSSLVEPLKIGSEYMLNMTDFLQQVSSIYSDMGSVQSAQSRAAINEADAHLKEMESARTQLEGEIVQKARDAGFSAATSADNICRQGGIADNVPDIKNDCLQLEQIKDLAIIDRSTISIEAGKAIIADKLQVCLSTNNYTISECKTRVRSALTQAISRVNSLGNSGGWVFPTQDLTDYAEYVNAVLGFYEALRSYNPSFTLTNTQLMEAAIPGGSFVGFPLDVARYLLKSPPGPTLRQINSIYESAKIEDEELKAKLYDQVMDIRRKLGVTQ